MAVNGTSEHDFYLTWHWTAGKYDVTNDEMKAYHFLIDGEGKTHKGYFSPEDNVPPMKAGKYAQHVLRANSYNIGVSMCGMYGSTEAEARKGNYGPYPLKQAQVEAALDLTAQLCRQYGIPAVPARLLAHEEWDSIHGRHQDRWDVCCIPHRTIRPQLLKDGTYASMNWVRAEVAKRLAGLETNPDRFRPIFQHIVGIFDDPEFANLPAEVRRLVKQLRSTPPLEGLKR